MVGLFLYLFTAVWIVFSQEAIGFWFDFGSANFWFMDLVIGRCVTCWSGVFSVLGNVVINLDFAWSNVNWGVGCVGAVVKSWEMALKNSDLFILSRFTIMGLSLSSAMWRAWNTRSPNCFCQLIRSSVSELEFFVVSVDFPGLVNVDLVEVGVLQGCFCHNLILCMFDIVGVFL